MPFLSCLKVTMVILNRSKMIDYGITVELTTFTLLGVSFYNPTG